MPYRINAITGELDLVMDASSSGGITQIDTDSGSVLPVAGVVNLLGDSAQGVSTSGAGDTATITVADATESQKGVVELATDAEAIAGTDSTNLAIIPSSLAAKLGTQTQYGLAIGNSSSGAFNWTAAGTDGQIPIAATGGDPAFASLTSTGGTISFTPGTNTLNLEAGSTTPTTFTTDSGNAIPSGNILNVLGGTLLGTTGSSNNITINADDNVVGSVATDGSAATPTSNAFTIAGGNNCTTSGSGATVTIDVDANVADSFPTDSGTATPSSGALTVAGGTGISTSGGASTVTIDLDSPVSVANGGTGATSLTDGGIVLGSAGAAVTVTSQPTNGQLLIGSSGGDPVLATLTEGDNISITEGAGSITIAANSEDQVVNVTALDDTDSPYTALSTDYYMSCNVSGGVLTIDLPDAPSTGRVFIVKDSGGDAATSNITVTTTGGSVTIDGATTFVMNTDLEAAQFIFNGTSYEVF